MSLSKAQIKHLKKSTHALKPVVRLGQNGLTEPVLEEVRIALDHHELIKIKLNVGDRDERDSVLASICEQTASECVQQIGHVAVLYKKNEQSPGIVLPKA